MQRVSDKGENRTAAWVIALIFIVLVIAFLMGEAIVVATDDPITADARLLQAGLLILFVTPLAAQLLDARKFGRRGPRMLVEQLRTPVVLLALLIALRQPDATMSVGDALRDWALLLAIIALVSGYDIGSRLADLRHKRRVLRIMGRNVLGITIGACALALFVGLINHSTAAQILWAAIIIAAVAAGNPSFWDIKIAPAWWQGRIALHSARFIADTAFFGVLLCVLGGGLENYGAVFLVSGSLIAATVSLLWPRRAL